MESKDISLEVQISNNEWICVDIEYDPILGKIIEITPEEGVDINDVYQSKIEEVFNDYLSEEEFNADMEYCHGDLNILYGVSQKL